jgi:CRP/FNR family transcriptional regulator, anaerobic regulatory protein
MAHSEWMSWTASLDASLATRKLLDALPVQKLSAGTPLFHTGDHAQSFVIVVKGRIEVRLTAHSGREILLYAVEAGQSCVQTTLGLLGDEVYTGAAIAIQPTEVVLIAKPAFLRLMDEDRGFRTYVLQAFGRRMTDLTHVLELVAFERIEVRLATLLLSLAEVRRVNATQADLAARIGSAREVVSRHLHQFGEQGLTRTERGHVEILDEPALRRISLGHV